MSVQMAKDSITHIPYAGGRNQSTIWKRRILAYRKLYNCITSQCI